VPFIPYLSAPGFRWVAGVLFCGFASCNHPAVESELQRHFTTELQQAVGHFQQLHQADTLDFGKLAPFEWDTVYVFDSYVDTYHLGRDMDRPIDWKAAMAPAGAVPEETTRFIFVKGNTAVQSLDMSRSLIGEAHFTKYYPDTLGRVTTVYFDASGRFRPYTVNHFAKAAAKFILVCNVDFPSGDTTRNAYLPLRLLKEKWFVSHGVRPTNLVDLHPLTGCGRPSCWANDSVYQAEKPK
jgi:hypothetical protein